MNAAGENLLLINGALALFLAILAVHPVRRRELGKGTLWLAALLATFGLIFLDWWLYPSEGIRAMPFLVGYLWVLPMFLGPLFYGFSLWLLGAGSAARFNNGWFWARHWLPVLAFVLVILPFLSQPAEVRLNMVRADNVPESQSWIVSIRLLCYAVSILFYSGLSVWRTRRTQADVSFRENVLIVRWSAFMLTVVSVLLIIASLLWAGPQLIVLICLIFILIAGQAAFVRIQPAIRQVQESKYRNSELPDSVVATISEQVRWAMEHELWFLEDNTSLGALADKFNVTGHQMSQIINRGFNQSYAGFINHYRIKHAAKLLLSQPDDAIVDIATTCGYGSKSSFYQAFRKQMNCSPSEFRHQRLARDARGTAPVQ